MLSAFHELQTSRKQQSPVTSVMWQFSDWVHISLVMYGRQITFVLRCVLTINYFISTFVLKQTHLSPQPSTFNIILHVKICENLTTLFSILLSWLYLSVWLICYWERRFMSLSFFSYTSRHSQETVSLLIIGYPDIFGTQIVYLLFSEQLTT